MFSFKKKKKEISSGATLSQITAVVSAIPCGVREIKREAAIVELKRLKQDHWDKDAFDRVIKFICEI